MKHWMFALALGVLGAGAGSAAAQEDDSSFAKKLAYRGWFDLADVVVARIERDSSLPRDVRTAIPILMAEIELAKADRETEPEKQKTYLDSSIEKLKKFITAEDS